MVNWFKKKTPDYRHDSDAQLMLDFKAGNQAAFEALMRKYYPRVLNFIYRYLGNQSTAEDLTQDVFMRAYKAAPRYQPRSQFQTWLFTIAKNVSLNELRRHKNAPISLDTTPTDEDEKPVLNLEDKTVISPERQVLKKERAIQVQAAIQSLPDNQRTAVLLRRYEDFSYQEIAETMKLSISAVKSLLSRAKINLKNELASQLKHG
ncbi:MAG: sigma-70 family RNA polymerase sigma factor [Desulfobacterales bacterium]|nr:sigma-70 family RNA polymerase sigma factor [Desulfobacterales bacterium]MDJ0913525.1 sigma-70 family RNA polymerase sigma factor [Desulfobacterales bacterium]